MVEHFVLDFRKGLNPKTQVLLYDRLTSHFYISTRTPGDSLNSFVELTIPDSTNETTGLHYIANTATLRYKGITIFNVRGTFFGKFKILAYKNPNGVANIEITENEEIINKD